jgi:hypothetical protein
MILGTYSTIYVALPLTEWLDRVLFQRVGGESAATKAKPAKPASPSAA